MSVSCRNFSADSSKAFSERLKPSRDSVALCKGVMLSISPKAQIIDLTHQVTPYSILDGARFLFGASPYFSNDAVFVTVIDPGVGTKRRSIVVKTKRARESVCTLRPEAIKTVSDWATRYRRFW